MKKAGVTKTSKGNRRRIKRGLFFSPIKGFINADVNGARNILRKFKKKWFDLLSEGISESLQYAGIGVVDGVNPPGGIRVGETYQTPSEPVTLVVGSSPIFI